MSASPDSPAFNIAAAADAARNDYPRETKRLGVIDLSQPDGAEQAVAWMRRNEPLMPAYEATAELNTTRQANAFLRRIHGELLLGARSSPRTRYLGGDAAAEAAYAFDHELGHAVTAFGLPDGAERGAQMHQRARWEIQADVFAVLRGINRGTMTREQAYTLSQNRAMRPPGPHVTSPAIDMALGEKTDEQIRAMTPQQIADMAIGYGEMLGPKQGEIEALAKKLDWVRMEPAQEEKAKAEDKGLRDKLGKVFAKITRHSPRAAALPAGQMKLKRLTNEEWLENVADLFDKSAPGTLARHTATRILHSVFTTGKAGHPVEKEFDTSHPKWDKLRRKFTP